MKHILLRYICPVLGSKQARFSSSPLRPYVQSVSESALLAPTIKDVRSCASTHARRFLRPRLPSASLVPVTMGSCLSQAKSMVRRPPRGADVMHRACVTRAWGCLDSSGDARHCSLVNMHVPVKPKGQRQAHFRSQQPFAFPPVLATEFAAAY